MSQEDDEIRMIAEALGLKCSVDELEVQDGRNVFFFHFRDGERMVVIQGSEGATIEITLEEFTEIAKHIGSTCFSCDDGALVYAAREKEQDFFLICNECGLEHHLVDGELIPDED
ncbi:MAG: hypothetical protein WAX80_03665 [Minisyncoccia bacterium]